MNQVFLVLVHKNPEQLKLLLNQLQSDKSQFFIHVDLKSRIEDFIEETKSIKNIRFVNERYDVQWGSFSIVSATLALIKELSRETDIEYSHAHLISGEDLLIKPIYQLNKFFSENSGINYMNFSPFPIDSWWKGGFYRIKHYHFGRLKPSKTFFGKAYIKINNYIFIIFPFLKKRLIKNIKFYGGSAWWSLTKESIDYISNTISENPKFVKFFKYSLLPDEIFFQTIILNSVLKDKVNPDYKRYITWNIPNNGSPDYISMADFKNLANSDSYFARKINFDNSRELYKIF